MADNNATVAIRARKLPIIIVPGTMGSRLMDPATQKTVWNPLGFPISPLKATGELGDFAADLKRLEQVNQPLVGDTHVFARNFRARGVSHIRHFHTVIRKFYGKLALELHEQLTKLLAPKGIFPVLYCAGYDFRVDNASSAQTLKRVVDEAQKECGGEQVIIIAHSMGGLVTRFFCKNLGGEKQVKRVFLLASPTHGAPDAYFSLRNGLEAGGARFLIFNDIFNGDKSRRFALKMPSVYQLLPTQLYCRIDTKWLRFDPNFTGISPDPSATAPIGPLQFKDLSNTALLYTDLYTGLAGDPEFRNTASTNLGVAFRFEVSLAKPSGNTYFHPNTTVVLTQDLKTITGGHVDFQGQVAVGGNQVVVSNAVAEKTAAGDETVVAISANPAFTEPPPALVQIVAGASHQSLPVDSAVKKFLIDQISGAP